MRNISVLIDDLWERNELLELFFENSVMLLSISDDKGYLTYVNKAWCDTLDRTKAEIENTPFMSFVHPDDYDRTVNAYNEGNQKESEVLGFRNRYKRKDGSYVEIEWFATTPSKDRRYWFNVCIAHEIIKENA